MKGSRLFVSGMRFLLVMLLMAAGSQFKASAQAVPAPVPLPGKNIPKFVDPLPRFFDPVNNVNLRVNARTAGTALEVSMVPTKQQVLSTGTLVAGGAVGGQIGLTNLWAYKTVANGVTYGPLWPAFTIETQQGAPITVKYRNLLNGQTYANVGLTVDQTLHWANPLGYGMMDPLRMNPYTDAVPGAVHLHGGEVPSSSDGGPDQWVLPEGVPAPPGGSNQGSGYNPNPYVYPNTQEPATLFFHDHTLGATRLNLYAGLAGIYLLRGGFDTGIPAPGGLPAGKYEVELGIQDRMFDNTGQLYFPSLGINPTLHPFWSPEFFGDAICVNGKTWPYLNVEARRYRFRIVNGSNARFYELFLANANGKATPLPAIWQIGSDGGLLDAPVNVSKLPGGVLLLGTGERADIIIDFAAAPGATLVLKNSAKAPYPHGTTVDPNTTAQIMQFRVGPALAAGTVDNTYNPAAPGTTTLRATPVVRLSNPVTGTANVAPAGVRQLTLKEVMGAAGPAEVLVNNSKWMDGPTETPQVGSTEIWEIVNLTMDAHPIHLHLVQFQLLNRQQFQTNKYVKAYNAAFPGGWGHDPMMNNMLMYYPAGVFIPGFGPPYRYDSTIATQVIGGKVCKVIGGNPDVTPYLQGAPRPPLPNETGWKDTYLMYPGEVTRVIVRWAPQSTPVNGATAGTNSYGFDPTVGPGYVWHCHIVDHEDNEMMRQQMITNTPVFASMGALNAEARGEAAAQAREALPASYELSQNYPNPFNPSTEIRFALPSDSHVNLSVYNNMGQLVQTLIDRDAPAGYHTVRLDAQHLASGIYFYRLTAGTFASTQKMILMK